MAVPLLLASERPLSTLHKGISVVFVEEGLLVIHFQPAWFSQPARFFSNLGVLLSSCAFLFVRSVLLKCLFAILKKMSSRDFVVLLIYCWYS